MKQTNNMVKTLMEQINFDVERGLLTIEEANKAMEVFR